MSRQVGKWVAINIKDLTKFDPGNHKDCAWARALNRSFPGKRISAGGSNISIGDAKYYFEGKALDEYRRIFNMSSYDTSTLNIVWSDPKKAPRPIEFFVPAPKKFTEGIIRRIRLPRKKAA